jgi:hypothetical protein
MFVQQPILEEILVEQQIVSQGTQDAEHRLFICGEVVPSVSNASAVCNRRLVRLRVRVTDSRGKQASRLLYGRPHQK